MKICPDCKRHVRLVDASCPFCGAGVPVVTGLGLAMSLGLAMGLVGCGPAVDAGSDVSSSGMSSSGLGTSTSSTSSSSSTTDAGSTSSTASTGGTESSSGGRSFIDDDVGSGGVYGIECNVWDQDCGEGQKCVPWSNDGGDGWNAVVCRAVAPRPQTVGESCEVASSRFSGSDDCDADSLCFDVDADTLRGTCVARCGGSEAAPECPSEAVCAIEAYGTFNYCLPACDPLMGGCEGCVAVASGDFVCVLPGEVAVGEACSAFNACVAGASCLPSGLGEPVCVTTCEPEGAPCEGDAVCTAWGDAGLCVPGG